MTTWKYSIPSPPLSTCIDSFCFYDGDETLSSGKERCLPDGQAFAGLTPQAYLARRSPLLD